MINVEVSAINSRDGHFWNIKIHRPLQGLNPAGQPISTFTANEGVGLNDHSRRKAFSFAETSQSHRWDRLQDQQSYAAVRAPLASLGVGLPLSRTMMRMFGGDITLQENKSHGCTATLIISTDPTILERVI